MHPFICLIRVVAAELNIVGAVLAALLTLLTMEPPFPTMVPGGMSFLFQQCHIHWQFRNSFANPGAGQGQMMSPSTQLTFCAV